MNFGKQKGAGSSEKYRKVMFQLVARADPIISGHAGETRNLAESTLVLTGNPVDIVTYNLEDLKNSSLPLKKEVMEYSKEISVHRPIPISDYKILAGSTMNSLISQVIKNVNRDFLNVVMSLYLSPHARIVNNAIAAIKMFDKKTRIVSVSEAVGSDITNVVRNAVREKHPEKAKLILNDYLSSNILLAVSKFTKSQIIKSASSVLERKFVEELDRRIRVSYPAVDTDYFLSIEKMPQAEKNGVLKKYGLAPAVKKPYIFFFSRITFAKGVDDLILAFNKLGKQINLRLVIGGEGPQKEEYKKLARKNSQILFLDGVSDKDKGVLMNQCAAFVLPTKPRPEFVETLGIALVEKLLSGGLGPIVTCRTGGVPEATDDNNLYVKAGNIRSISEGIKLALSLPEEKKKMIMVAGQNYASRTFDRMKITTSILEMCVRFDENKRR